MNNNERPQEMTEADIDLQIAMLIKKRDELRRTERVLALKQASELVAAWKLTVAELFPNLQASNIASLADFTSSNAVKSEKRSRRPAEAKYYHPSGVYWTGRGLRPKVFANVDLSLYAIKKKSSVSSSVDRDGSAENPGANPTSDADIEQGIDSDEIRESYERYLAEQGHSGFVLSDKDIADGLDSDEIRDSIERQRAEEERLGLKKT